jgi:hypothetical protein
MDFTQDKSGTENDNFKGKHFADAKQYDLSKPAAQAEVMLISTYLIPLGGKAILS